MGLDVLFKRDIANFLRSAAAANLSATGLALEMQNGQNLDGIPQEILIEVYRRGYFAALLAVGLAAGLEPATSATVQQVDKGAAVIPAWVETRAEG